MSSVVLIFPLCGLVATLNSSAFVVLVGSNLRLHLGGENRISSVDGNALKKTNVSLGKFSPDVLT